MYGQEILWFHRFVQEAADFKAWWEKFNSQPKSNIQSPINAIEPTTSKFATDDEDRVSPEQIRQLRQLLASKK
jgi:hypothetical protein